MTTPPPNDPFAPPPQQPSGYPPPPQPGAYPPPPQQGYQQPYPQQGYQQPYPQQGYQQPGYDGGYSQPGYGMPRGGPGSTAGMGNRLLARILDAIIVGIPAFIIMAIAGFGVFANADCHTGADGVTRCTGGAGSIAGFFIAYFVVFLLAILYELYFIGTKGATPGKKIMGVKVVDEQTGGTIGMGRAFIRYLVLGVTGSICTLGYWSPFFDNSKRNRGGHDKAANDLVISTK